MDAIGEMVGTSFFGSSTAPKTPKTPNTRTCPSYTAWSHVVFSPSNWTGAELEGEAFIS